METRKGWMPPEDKDKTGYKKEVRENIKKDLVEVYQQIGEEMGIKIEIGQPQKMDMYSEEVVGEYVDVTIYPPESSPDLKEFYRRVQEEEKKRSGDN